jgi:hypothetical protein
MKKKTVAAKSLSGEREKELLSLLKLRFEKQSRRHPTLRWSEVEARLAEVPEKLWSLSEMERTGGEPDVIGREESTGLYLFVDCSAQSPEGRASLCYDREALDSRKEHKPKGSVVELAAEMGVELLTEEQYRALQCVGEFDTKSSSWIQTPREIRSLGGALFCDRRYGRVFVYHNGAQSYYSGRGFRGILKV